MRSKYERMTRASLARWLERKGARVVGDLDSLDRSAIMIGAEFRVGDVLPVRAGPEERVYLVRIDRGREGLLLDAGVAARSVLRASSYVTGARMDKKQLSERLVTLAERLSEWSEKPPITMQHQPIVPLTAESAGQLSDLLREAARALGTEQTAP